MQRRITITDVREHRRADPNSEAKKQEIVWTSPNASAVAHCWYPFEHHVDNFLRLTLTSFHKHAQAPNVETHSRAGWKISDYGLLSGNAGSARGKRCQLQQYKKKKSERNKNMIPMKKLSWGLFEAVRFIFQCPVFIVH